ncbi:MAG: hypothetical protein IJ125_00925 [Atopobiaceae bacterium]|nr:hypothetical protein [Atopobiaceae bacterium]
MKIAKGLLLLFSATLLVLSMVLASLSALDNSLSSHDPSQLSVHTASAPHLPHTSSAVGAALTQESAEAREMTLTLSYCSAVVIITLVFSSTLRARDERLKHGLSDASSDNEV